MKSSKGSYFKRNLILILFLIAFIYLARMFRYLFWGATGVIAVVIVVILLMAGMDGWLGKK
jgi:hypothetical protein